MQDNIINVEDALNDFVKKFQYRLRVNQTSLEHFKNEAQNLQEEYLEAYPEKAEDSKILFENLIENFILEKEDTSFFQETIPRLRKILVETLQSIDENSYTFSEIQDLIPNTEFKRLVDVKILTTTTPIYSKFKGKTISGHLTENGFFELAIDNRKILFSSFRTAAEFAWEKEMTNDCWGVWTADENGSNYSMKYFRQKLRDY